MTNQKPNTENNKPIQTFRDGCINLRIWEKDHQNEKTGAIRTYYSIDLKRGYKQNDEWKHTNIINGDDALKVANLYNQANAWLLEHKHPSHTQAA